MLEKQYSLLQRLLRPLVRKTLDKDKFKQEVGAEAARCGLRDEDRLQQVEETADGDLNLVTYDAEQEKPRVEPITLQTFSDIAARLRGTNLLAEVKGTAKIIQMPQAIKSLPPDPPTDAVGKLAAALRDNAFASPPSDAKFSPGCL